MPWTAEKLKAKRDERRRDRLCTECGSDLKPLLDWHREQCPECVEKAAARTKRYRAEHRDRFKASRRRSYRRRAMELVCVECPLPAAPGRRRCEAHHEAHHVSDARYLDRKEAARAA